MKITYTSVIRMLPKVFYVLDFNTSDRMQLPSCRGAQGLLHTLCNEKINGRQITAALPRRTIDLPINNCQPKFSILKWGKK
jgi:hypothetical protein